MSIPIQRKISSKIKYILSILTIGWVTFLVYQPSLYNDFINVDTHEYVTNNPHIQALTWENLQWMLVSFHAANWHPLTWLSHAIDYALYGLHPWGHHLTNIIIHCLNTMGVFLLAIVLITQANSHLKENQILFAAGIAAMGFGIHPQHVEVVAWIAERKELLCNFFLLITCFFYIFYTIHNSLAGYLAALLGFLLALLSKPMAVTLPVILILIDVYPLQRSRLTPYRRLVLEKIPFFIFTALSILLTILAQQSFKAVVSLELLGIEIRLLNAFNSLISYIAKFLFPIGLSPVYPYPTYRSFHEHYLSLLPILGTFLITFVSGYVWWVKKQFYWLITWLFYVVTLSPVIGIIQVGSQAMADRYAYLPTLPFYLLIGLGVSHLYFNFLPNFQKLALVTVVILAGVWLSRLTFFQIGVWKSDLTYWYSAMMLAPEDAMTRFRLGSVYFAMGDYPTALTHYLLIKNSRIKDYHKQLALTYLKLNKLTEALAVYQKMLQENIDTEGYQDTIYYYVGWIYFKQRLFDQAQASLKKSLEINHNQLNAKNLLESITH